MQGIQIPEEINPELTYLINRKRKESGQWEKEARISTLDKYIAHMREVVRTFAQQANKEKPKKDEKDALIQMNKIMSEATLTFDQLPSIKV